MDPTVPGRTRAGFLHCRFSETGLPVIRYSRKVGFRLTQFSETQPSPTVCKCGGWLLYGAGSSCSMVIALGRRLRGLPHIRPVAASGSGEKVAEELGLRLGSAGAYVPPLARDNEGIASGVIAASSFWRARPTERMKDKGDSGDVAEL